MNREEFNAICYEVKPLLIQLQNVLVKYQIEELPVIQVHKDGFILFALPVSKYTLARKSGKHDFFIKDGVGLNENIFE